MELRSLNITESPEELKQNVILRYFKLSGKGSDILGIENIPKIVEAGFVGIALKGECKLMFDSKVCRLKAGQMFVGFATTVVQTLWKSKDFECVVLATNVGFMKNIDIPSVSELFLAIRNNPCVSLSEGEMKTLPSYFEYLHLYYERDHPYRLEMTSHLLLVLCYEVASIYQRTLSDINVNYSYKDMIFKNFINLVSLKFQSEQRVAYYARELSITPKYLSMIVKEVSHKSASEWITDFVLRRAKMLLSTTGLTIQQISDQLNFPNPSFFAQYFKRGTGKTPKEFRGY